MKYKVGDLSKVLGVTTNTIRRYENSGYLQSERDDSDYRWYTGYDICKAAFIRLFMKCGFSHTEIKEMLNNSPDKITEICINRLNEIDKEMDRLYFLRHWLKDNIQLMETVDDIGSGFTVMDCPALRYIFYGKGDDLFNEKERLDTIYKFMYTIPEVQLIHFFKLEDVNNNIFIPYKGWAMKEVDIKRLKAEDIILNNEFIEIYPVQKCLYGVIEIPSESMNNLEDINKIQTDFFNKAYKHLNDHNMEISGDPVEFLVTILGNVSKFLVCIPFTQIKR